MKTIDFAIKMELDGEKFFLEQAQLNKDNQMHKVYLLLAAEEKQHAKILKKRKLQEEYALSDNLIRDDIKKAFKEAKSLMKVHSDKQLDIYRMAYQMEENSIKMYFDLMTKTKVPENIELYAFLIEQEQEHLRFFDDLVQMLVRAEEWVESAEFGVRDEY